MIQTTLKPIKVVRVKSVKRLEFEAYSVVITINIEWTQLLVFN